MAVRERLFELFDLKYTYLEQKPEIRNEVVCNVSTLPSYYPQAMLVAHSVFSASDSSTISSPISRQENKLKPNWCCKPICSKTLWKRKTVMVSLGAERDCADGGKEKFSSYAHSS